jgi:hypothetical protein
MVFGAFWRDEKTKLSALDLKLIAVFDIERL